MGDTSRPLGEDDDLIELLWCNGHVVMQSQTNRKVPPRPEKAAVVAPPAPASVPQEDEGGLWFPFALADSLDKDIFSEFFYEAPAPAPAGVAAAALVASGGTSTEAAGGKSCRDDVPAEADRREACPVSEDPCDLMPPPKSTPASCSRQQTMSLANGGGDNAGDLSDLVVRAGSAGKSAAAAAAEAGASSMLSVIGSSICGSNQVLVQRAVGAPGRPNANAMGGRGNEASSSGRSNYCFGTAATTTTTTTTTEPTSTSNRSSKRKRLDTEDSESPSEDAESESAAMLARKPPQKMTTARRSRAAEVHNLSERRRRDRINEKMRALQELIPNCNKETDKASMLDEAIEYLKSLQLQVQATCMQMMWMGSGIAAAPPAVMFPGVHQYLPRMGVGMGPAAAMPSMPRLPFMAAPQPVVPANAQVNVNPVPGYRGHHLPAAAVGITEPYGHYLGINHLQPPPSQLQVQHYAQGVGYYPPLGAKAVQQQAPELHHVPGPGGSMPAGAAPGVLPPESAPAPSRGPAG